MKIRITKRGRVTRCRLGAYEEEFQSGPLEIEWWIAEVGDELETVGSNGFYIRIDDAEVARAD